MNWRDQEFLTQREHQAAPGDLGGGPSDVASQGGKISDMAATPPGEPPVDYDVRSTYEARPVNARDFNFSKIALGTVSGSGAIIFPEIDFVSAKGWRFVVLDWEVVFSPSIGSLGGSLFQATSVNLLAGGGVADPFNSGIIIGPNGTGANTIKTFMIVEENTRFGIQILNTDTTLTLAATAEAIVTIHGNALPVTDVQLPYQIANPIGRGTKIAVGGAAGPGFVPMPESPAASAAQSARVAPPQPPRGALNRQHGYTSLIDPRYAQRGGGIFQRPKKVPGT